MSQGGCVRGKGGKPCERVSWGGGGIWKGQELGRGGCKTGTRARAFIAACGFNSFYDYFSLCLVLVKLSFLF